MACPADLATSLARTGHLEQTWPCGILQAATQRFYYSLLEELRKQENDSLTILVIGPWWHWLAARVACDLQPHTCTFASAALSTRSATAACHWPGSTQLRCAGKESSGKTALVSALVNENTNVPQGFGQRSRLPRPQTTVRRAAGFTLNVIDCPGLTEGDTDSDMVRPLPCLLSAPRLAHGV